MERWSGPVASLDDYRALMQSRPDLFLPRPMRPIVTDRATLAAYASEHGPVIGVAFQSPYLLFLVDLVSSRADDGQRHLHPYLRVVSRARLVGGTNVVVLATIEDASLGNVGSIVVVEQERHAPGTRETELPRGFGEPGVSAQENALRELRTETGYVGDHAELLGTTMTDSGLTDATVAYYHVPVTSKEPWAPELEEAIANVRTVTRDDLWDAILSGAVTDSFTLQGMALYDKRRGR